VVVVVLLSSEEPPFPPLLPLPFVDEHREEFLLPFGVEDCFYMNANQ
jgi:hypothetical protein